MTTEQMLWTGIATLAVVVLLLLGYLLGSRGRGRAAKGEVVALPPGAEALAPAFSELRAQLNEVRGQIAGLQQASAAESERHKSEDQAWDRLSRVETTLPTIQQSIQAQIAEAMRDLGTIKELQAAERQRWGTEDSAFESLQRLSAIMLGSATSGAAAERVVEGAFDGLPPQWRINNHTVNGKTVEFALRLPDGMILPIDSKLVAQSDLDALEKSQDNRQREHLKREIQRKVLDKAAEVQKYVDGRSVGFAIAAVSDAVYALSGPVLPEAYQKHRALLVPYSLLRPFMLMIYEQHQHGGDVDAAQLARLVGEAQRHLGEASSVLNGHLSGAVTTLTNARDKLGRELAAAAGAIEQIRGASDTPDAPRASRSA
jgi:DNA recombination protein RmuC